MSYTNRRKIAVDVVQNAIANETHISEPEDVTRVFAAIKPLLMDEEDQGEEPRDPVLFFSILSLTCWLCDIIMIEYLVVHYRKILKKSKIA